ncbi:hypothetical protein F511_04497 [Dorcoceras hygrometricum]|uniref:Uncharacterized protein n=1 Tax=Dorcoceras hygrometricum TaxID=472368 RepID=A0A2Z7C892_9LAMI|nr:hypothetical protein F511_04497 [Dorcoceras hygrometricum]
MFLILPTTRRDGSGSNPAGRRVANTRNRNRTVKRTGRSGLRVESIDPVNRTVDYGPSPVRVRVKPGPWPDLVVPEKSNAIIGVVTTGFECLPPSCDGLTGPDDHGPMISTG